MECACCVWGDCGGGESGYSALWCCGVGALGGVRAWGRGRGAGEVGEGGEVSFSEGGFGGKYHQFLFRSKDGDGSCAGRGLG